MTELTCIVCPLGCTLQIDDKENVTGHGCKRGVTYARKELLHPTRTITSTVRIDGAIHRRIPVKTNDEVPKSKIFDVMKALDHIVVQAPIDVGTVVLANVCDTGVDVVTTRSMTKKDASA
jgi:CxxC motif-containing protein